MQELVITKKGQELMAKMVAGTATATFVKVRTSERDYSAEMLEDLTELQDVKQEVLISKVSITDAAVVEVLAAIHNSDLTDGYYVRALGLYVKDSDDNELLYGVSTETENPIYMPKFGGKTVSGISYVLNTKVNRAEQVTLEVNPAAVATVDQVRKLEENMIYHVPLIYSGGTFTMRDLPTQLPEFFSVRFKATADYAEGDGFEIHGTPYMAVLSNGEPAPAEVFKAGATVLVQVNRAEKRINFSAAGGESVNYNLFCQPEEPEGKTGVWLKTATKERFKTIEVDDNVWVKEQWRAPGTAESMARIRDQACSVSVGDEVFIFGGDIGGGTDSSAIAYNTKTNNYRNLTAMPVGRYQGCCALVGDEVCIFGGLQNSYDLPHSAIAYNIGTDSYRNLANMPDLRVGACCALVGDEIFIFGGTVNTKTVLQKAIAYNHVTDRYRDLLNMPIACANACCAYMGNEVLIFGGHDAEHKTSDRTVCYSPSANTYRDLRELPTPLENACSAPVGDEVFIFGGYNGDGLSNSAIAYNPSTDTYRPLADMATGRQYPCCARVGHQVFVFGGRNRDNLDTVEVLSLTTKQYAQSPTLVLDRAKGDVPHQTSLVDTKKFAALPITFSDAMLFKDGEMLFPELYIGDGKNWNKIREGDQYEEEEQ